MSQLTCRFCATPLHYSLIDLGMSPLSNSYVRAEQLDGMEPFYPLHVRVCDQCFLVQLPELQTPEHIFGDYAYFSSYSTSWLQHSKRYAEAVTTRFHLNANHQIIEVASNDGYLLRFFQEDGLRVLGVEPAANVARVAQDAGIPTQVKFFGVQTARELVEEGYSADLLVANNVLGHVPDLNDFIAGLQTLLSPQGVLTVEFQHVLRLMENSQFDTIYHEHFSYLSLLTIEKMFVHHGLRVFDVEELSTHGGSLRVYACRADNNEQQVGERVAHVRLEEAGLDQMETYAVFSERAHQVRYGLLEFLIQARREGKVVAGYGAPAKGNTLLNSCGVKGDLLPYTVDLSPHKQGLFLPGTHIPILAPSHVTETRPDYLLLLAWNLKDEIIAQMSGVRGVGLSLCGANSPSGSDRVRFVETPLRGAYVIDIDPIEDERGFFARAWCRDEWEKHGLESQLNQCNISFNRHKNTLRGMHFQIDPHEEVKLVRCTRGAIYDVIVDLRPNSPTWKQWFAVELTADNHRMLYVPGCMAHGLQTLEDDTEVFYQMSHPYHPASARGVRWDDPAFNISWPAANERIISRVDRELADYA